jgi:hypothetical protein
MHLRDGIWKIPLFAFMNEGVENLYHNYISDYQFVTVIIDCLKGNLEIGDDRPYLSRGLAPT